MAVLIDPTGAEFGLWQPNGHHGFEVFGNAGAPIYHQLTTPRRAGGATTARRSTSTAGSSTGRSKPSPTPTNSATALLISTARHWSESWTDDGPARRRTVELVLLPGHRRRRQDGGAGEGEQRQRGPRRGGHALRPARGRRRPDRCGLQPVIGGLTRRRWSHAEPQHLSEGMRQRRPHPGSAPESAGDPRADRRGCRRRPSGGRPGGAHAPQDRRRCRLAAARRRRGGRRGGAARCPRPAVGGDDGLLGVIGSRRTTASGAGLDGATRFRVGELARTRVRAAGALVADDGTRRGGRHLSRRGRGVVGEIGYGRALYAGDGRTRPRR